MNINNILEFSITILTEIYNKKKSELIEICISQNLKSIETVQELRAWLSKYFKGKIEINDIKDTLTEKEKQDLINKSQENKIAIDNLDLENNLEEDNEYYNIGIKEEIEKTKILYENINNKAQDITNKIENIINNSENQLSDNIYDSIEFNNPASNSKNYELETPKDNSNDNNTIKQISNEYFLPTTENKTQHNQNFLGDLEKQYSTINKNRLDKKENNMTERKRNLQMTPDYFTGNEDVKNCFKQYKMITDFNDWTEKDKIKFLPLFVKGTASSFLDNLNNLKENWTWKEIEDAFIDQYLPIDYNTFLKTNLENRRQGESESATSFMTEIESLCGQIDTHMKEEEICIYILKGLEENILNTISMQDNTTLKKFKKIRTNAT